MRKSFNNDGFTLIEVILSIAIIAVLAMACLTLFANSFKTAVSNGTRTKGVFDAQDKITQAIGSIDSVDGDTDVKVESASIPIKIYSSDGNFVTLTPVSGSMVTADSSDGNSVALSVFIPNN